jgi:tetratricopeptide (TPR) repeat protein/transcriptional regulator with XRE-family HTH domain
VPKSPIPLGPAGLEVARRLVELRHERSMTLAALSARLTELGRPISISALSKTEQALRRTDADDLVALARALEVEPEELLGGGTGSRPHPASSAGDRLLGPPGQVRLHAPLSELPRPTTKVFVSRDDTLADLSRWTSGPDVAIQAVHGLGGVGKTELALRYSQAHRDRFSILWWITADSHDHLEAGLARLTGAVAARVGRQASPRAAEAATWAVGFLAANSPWLLVLDDVRDPADVAPLLGRLSGGQVLITSRRDAGWEELADVSVTLTVLDPAAATRLLISRSGQDDADTAAALAGELGHLPLALTQAASYISRTRIPMQDYVARLRAMPGPMLTADAPGAIGGTVGRQWDLTLSTIERVDPLAIDVLHVLSCLAPDDVPRPLLSGMADDPGEVDVALGLLASYSMVSLGERTVSVHRLVQAVVAEQARRAGALAAGLRRALDLIRRAQPDAGDASSWWASMIPHVEALVARWPADEADPELAELLTIAAIHLHRRGVYSAAIALVERALTIDEAALGPDDPHTLTDRDTLALGYRAVGRYPEAVALWERTLADRTHVLGPDHPDTLTTRANLAAGYWSAGRRQEAVALWERTLAERDRVLGPDNPDTLQSRSNLSFGYQGVGWYDEAIALDEQTLDDRLRILGPDHPRTLNSRNTLANGYRLAGRYAEAIALHEQTLDDRLRILGPDHPHTATTSSDLAADYRSAGRYDEAIALDEQALADRARILGPDHPRTLTSRSRLALDYEAVGRRKEAVTLWEQTVADLTRVLGHDHPDTRNARAALDRITDQM